MSEPINPGQGQADTAVAVDAPPTEAAAAGSSSRTLLIALLAVVGALILGAGLFLLFSNLGSSEPTTGDVATGTAPPPPPMTSATASPTLTSASPIPTQTLAGRDPFAPIYAPLPTTGGPTTGGPTTVGPTTGPTTVQPTTYRPTTVAPTTYRPTTVRPTTVKPTTSKPTPKPTSTSGDSYRIKLFGVIDNVADIRMNGVDYAPRKGETWASLFQYLRNYKDDCIGVLYGDQEFVICEGETVVID